MSADARLSRAPDIDLSGQVALVTGGATGIGLAIARELQRCGARVLLNDLRQEDIDAALLVLGADARGLAADVADAAEVDRLLERALEACGRLDIVVNNAAITAPTRPTLQQSPDDWQRVMDVNLRGTYLVSRAAGRGFVARQAGCILNIASLAGIDAMPASNDYGVSKAAVVMLTRTLAGEWGRHGIRVNALAPGFTEAPMLERMLATSPLDAAAYLRRIPLRRFAAAREIAGVAAFLCSPLASYVTGAVVPVDGGWSANGGP